MPKLSAIMRTGSTIPRSLASNLDPAPLGPSTTARLRGDLHPEVDPALVAHPRRAARISAPVGVWTGAVRGLTGAVTLAVLVGCGGGGGTSGAPLPPEAPLPPVTEVYPKVISSEAFTLKPGPEWVAPGGVVDLAYAGWNPGPGSAVLRPGMKVLFFGHPTTSSPGPVGPTSPGTRADFGPLEAWTGLGWAAPELERRFLPADGSGHARGPSWVYVNANGEAGGVALATITGPSPGGAPNLIVPFTAAGQDGKGANAHLTGTFVAFRQDWQRGDPLQPFAGGKALRLSARLSVGQLSVGAADGMRQAKQQLQFTLINPECRRSGGGNLCQVEYLFNTTIARSHTTHWSQVGWFQRPQLWFDPAQGNMPVVDGSLGAPGSSAVHDESGLPLYRSFGSPSRHEPHGPEVFEVQVKFEELLSTLRLVAARSLQRPVEVIDQAALEQVFGPAATDPAAWSLLSVSVGQEISNAQPEEAVSIGGALHQLYVGPAS